MRYYADKRECRQEQKAIIEFLRSDLYERVATGGNKDTDGDWRSPLGWIVRLTRPDLAGGPLRIDATIFRPDGAVYERIEDVTVNSLDERLP